MMRLPAFLALLALALPALVLPARADPARLDPAGSAITLGPPQAWFGGWFGKDRPRPVTLRLAISRPVPFRLTLLGNPPRLVADFEDAELGGGPDEIAGAGLVPGLRWGQARPGTGRLVAELPGPYRIASAIQRTAGPAGAVIEIALDPVAAADFAPQPGLRNLPPAADLPGQRAAPDADPHAARPLRVMLDPGHGGADPGAEAGAMSEAALVLTFAQELAQALAARGIAVSMTRQDDRYLGLERRLSLARAAGAGLFISLHADALPAGQAAGATVYVWTPEADDRASAQLAARHGRDDLLAGVDLSGSDDALAEALIGVARTDTQPRSENFAKFVASGMALDGIGMHRRAVKGAAFSVLKAPDIPSVLVELGFITDPDDRANLVDPDWRARMVGVLAQAVANWQADETARQALLRR